MKNDFKNILNRLHELPESTRLKLAFIICFFSILGLFSLWVKKTSDKFAQIDINKPVTADKIEIATLLNDIKSNLANIKSILQDSLNSLFSSKQTSDKDEVPNQNLPSRQQTVQNLNDFPQLPASD